MKNISRMFVAACAAIACGMAGIGCWLAGNGNNDPSSANSELSAPMSQLTTTMLDPYKLASTTYTTTQSNFQLKPGRIYFFDVYGAPGGTGGAANYSGTSGGSGGRGNRAYGWYDMRDKTANILAPITIGANGSDGTLSGTGGTGGSGFYAGAKGGSAISASSSYGGSGGGGGGASGISISGTVVAVAGGGGGGGGGASYTYGTAVYRTGGAGGGTNGADSGSTQWHGKGAVGQNSNSIASAGGNGNKNDSNASAGVGGGGGGGGGYYGGKGGTGGQLSSGYPGGGGSMGGSYVNGLASISGSSRGSTTGGSSQGRVIVTEYYLGIPAAVPANGTGYTVSNPSTALITDGGSYTFTITTTLGYTNSVPRVTLTGNGVMDDTVTQDGNSYTFTVKNVTGTISPTDFTVTGVKKNKYSVTPPQSIENGYIFTLIESDGVIEHDDSYSFKLELLSPYTEAQPAITLDPTKGALILTNPTERIYTVENVKDTIVEKDFTVTISKNIYTVNFDTRGGSSITPRQVTHGNKVTRPIDPMLAGYKLEGWYTSLFFDREWNFSVDTATGPMTLYAKWVEGTPDPINPGDDDPNLPGDDDPNLPGNDDPNPPGGDPDESNMIWFVLTGVFIPLALLAAFLALFIIRKKKSQTSETETK